MKTLYIGTPDSMAKTIIERMGKEDHEIFFLSQQDFVKEKKPTLKYKYYHISKKADINKEVFHSIHPEAIIYVGTNFLTEKWQMNDITREYLSELSASLEYALQEETKVFVYLSSFDVYAKGLTKIDEMSEVCPVSLKGMMHAEGENMVEMYRKRGNMRGVTFRCADIFHYCYEETKCDFFDDMVETVFQKQDIVLEKEEYLQPLHSSDLADAISRILESTKDGTFNLCSSVIQKRSELFQMIAKKINKEMLVIVTDNDEQSEIFYSNEKAKKQLEWSDRKNLNTLLDREKINLYLNKNEVNKKEKHRGKGTSTVIRRLAENLFVFAMLYLLQYVFRDNTLFSSIDFMLIYVVLISVFFGIYHSALAIVLASIVFLSGENVEFMQMTNFYSYVGSVLKIAEYTFLGIVVAYTTEMLREELRMHRDELEMLTEELTELKVINGENVFIKNEYEKRLLNAKNSLPKLYSIIHKISVLDPEKIFDELLNVVADVMETKTVSVYLTKKNSSYARLMASMGEAPFAGGKSVDLSVYHNLYTSVTKGELYIGKKWHHEPAIVAPVMNRGECIAIIVINELPFHKLTLYQINLLRTLMILISEAIAKAMEYEEISRKERYVEQSDLLIYDEFVKKVQICYEKQNKNHGQCTVLKVDTKKDLLASYNQIAEFFRTTDILGINKMNEICILLGNNSYDEALKVLTRLSDHEIVATINHEFDYLGDSV